MIPPFPKSKNLVFYLILMLALLPIGCNQMSEIIRDDSAGMNGGFEKDESGLPVNWLVYSPKTVPNSDLMDLHGFNVSFISQNFISISANLVKL